jgi:hypothetical protein
MDESGRADHEWRIAQESFVALSVAAAMAFHEAQGRSTAAVGSAEEHDDALNLAASALSRLLTIYVVDELKHERVATKLDVLNGKFLRGATEFRRSNGVVVTAMTVKRGDLGSALSLIRRVGIPFGLAIEREPDEKAPAPEREPHTPEKK